MSSQSLPSFGDLACLTSTLGGLLFLGGGGDGPGATLESGMVMMSPFAAKADRIGRCLVLVRHGESVWNRQGLFTGLADVGITLRGRAEAEAVGQRFATEALAFDTMFTSTLRRARESAEIILSAMCAAHVPLVCASALNERDYGELTGLDETTAGERFGGDRVGQWRRGYAARPPCGESLEDVRSRVTHFYARVILPEMEKGRNLLVVGHSNSLRAFVMELDGLSSEQVEALEIATAKPIVYDYRVTGQLRRRSYNNVRCGST